jgi:hypothetical protein
MERRVEPELLDELPAGDPRATRSRRDLQRLNFLMGHTGIVARALRDASPEPPRRIVELGAGDGTFLLAVANRLAKHWRGVEVALVDRQEVVNDRTRDGFRALGWKVETIRADVFDWLARDSTPGVDCIVTNLFLHHFAESRLRTLLSLAAGRTRCFVACEPRRAPTVSGFSSLLGFIGCNDVTRHDAVVSVRAGFVGKELSALWPGDSNWQIQETEPWLFSHCLTAMRNSNPSPKKPKH